MKFLRTSLVTGVAICVLCGQTPAFAQKLAPTRDYSAYQDTSKERPDRQFGMPPFGRPATPEQKSPYSQANGQTNGPAAGGSTGSGAQEPEFPGGPGGPGGGQGGGAGDSPGAIANTPRNPLDEPPTTNDFFGQTTDFGLKRPSRGGGATTMMETPLSTTQDITPSTPDATDTDRSRSTTDTPSDDAGGGAAGGGAADGN
jgi:hypothetical protein